MTGARSTLSTDSTYCTPLSFSCIPHFVRSSAALAAVRFCSRIHVALVSPSHYVARCKHEYIYRYIHWPTKIFDTHFWKQSKRTTPFSLIRHECISITVRCRPSLRINLLNRNTLSLVCWSWRLLASGANVVSTGTNLRLCISLISWRKSCSIWTNGLPRIMSTEPMLTMICVISGRSTCFKRCRAPFMVWPEMHSPDCSTLSSMVFFRDVNNF